MSTLNIVFVTIFQLLMVVGTINTYLLIIAYYDYDPNSIEERIRRLYY